MTSTPDNLLGGIAETLLITLYVRATESQRPDAIIRDTKAIDLLQKLDYDFSRFEHIHMDEEDRVTLILRNREFDRCVRDFLERQPDGVVVHLGCGLDTRFDRVDNGRDEWYDLDIPEVIELRRKIIGDLKPRYHLLPFSAFDTSWFEQVSYKTNRPVLFLAEGVFRYFPEEQVRSLVLSLRDRFPGSELVFDAFAPWLVWANNVKFKISRVKMDVHYFWGMDDGKKVEKWDERIKFLGRWLVFNDPEPRLSQLRWMRHIRPLAYIIGVYRYRLG